MTPKRLHPAELVVLVAGLMSLTALAIDVMLPALPAMGEALGVAAENDRQLVVVAFVLGMGFGQLLFGPLSDRFGRRPVLIGSLIMYTAFGAACAIPGSFEQLVAFRAAQGVFAAGARVVALSLVRDMFSGAKMARIMSWVMMVFMAVPIAAPNLGYAILQVAAWPAIFWTLVVAGAGLALWAGARLPETLPTDRRRSIAPRALVANYCEVAKNPTSRAYTLALGFVFGSLFAFISASEQVFRAYDRAESFPLYFAGVASGMMVASFLNARLVERYGPRRLSLTALTAFCLIQGAYFALYMSGVQDFLPFYLSLMASFFCFSLIGANFNAMALTPLGHIAGTASAALGFTSTTLSGVLGGLVAAQFDGTPVPLTMGFLGLGLIALALAATAPRTRVPVVAEPVPSTVETAPTAEAAPS